MRRARGRVSQATAQACVKNSHHANTLHTELALLDKRRDRQVSTMHNNAVKMEKAVLSNSPTSATPPTVCNERARSASLSSPHRRLSSPHKGSVSPCVGPSVSIPRSLSPAVTEARRLSPQPSSLLPRRRPGSAMAASPVSRRKLSLPGTVQVTVSDLQGKVLQPSDTANQQSPPRLESSPSEAQTLHTNVPAIVVSEETENEHVNLPGDKKRSCQKTSSSWCSSSESDSGSEQENCPLSSLAIPHPGRLRSNSLPVIVPPSAFKPLSPRLSYTPPDLHLSGDLYLETSPRDRRSSFSGCLPAMRRGSIPERWGSVSERARPSSSRRGSRDMNRMLRDLRYGLLTRDVMRTAQGLKSRTSPPPSLLEQQFEELKNCRYLRVPSGHSSAEED